MSSSVFSASPRHGRALVTGAALLALLLSACGGGTEDNDGAVSPESDPAASPSPAEGEDQAGAEAGNETGSAFAEAELTDRAGNAVGTVSFTEVEQGVQVEAEVQDFSPGFRGFTIHETGLCEISSANEAGFIGDFYSAGAHLEGTPPQERGLVEGEDELEDPTDWQTPEGDVPGMEDTGGQDSQVNHPDHAGDLPNLLVNDDGAGFLSVVTDRLTAELLLPEEGTAVIVHSEADHHGNIPARYAPYGPDQESLITGDSGDRLACGVVEEAP